MTANFSGQETNVQGVAVLQRVLRADDRGAFARIFAAEELATWGYSGSVVQINYSRTVERGAVRGLHFQHTPFAEWKLVTCIRGRIFDVAVDIRSGSSTFLQWYGLELDGMMGKSLLIPPGCAHGFQVLDGPAELVYVHSQDYHPESEAGLRADDSRLGISWPLPIGQRSQRDCDFAWVDDQFLGVSL